MSERLTDERLGELEKHCAVVRDVLHPAVAGRATITPGVISVSELEMIVAELRARRAADPSAEDMEALKWAMDDLRADLNTSRYTEQWKKEAWAALAVLARLVEGGK